MLDSQALLWWLLDDRSLSAQSSVIISNRENEVIVSAATAWEIAIKNRLGKLPLAEQLLSDFSGRLASEGFTEMAILVRHGVRAGRLPGHHKDPFDRMLAAQCQSANLPIISNDKIFEMYGVRRIW